MKHYTKLSQLGCGSHATVYLVQDGNKDRFALKEFNLANENYEEVKQRFLSEKAALKSVNSQNIIKYIDAIESESRFAIVVELCEHGSLMSQLEEFGNFDLNNCLCAGISILNALEVLHSKGLIHRDIKPDNILQGAQGILKLADMGLVKGTGHESPDCQGSVDYMSPEQYTNYNNVDEKSDIYSVGASLYHLYTGSKVYDGTDLHDILDSHKNMIIPSVKEKRPDCPLSFNHIIRKMISKNPMDRYHTAAEAALDLQVVLSGAEAIQDLPSIKNILLESSSSNPALTIKPQKNPKKKNVILIAAILVVAVTILIILLSGSNTEETNHQQTDTRNTTTHLEPKVKIEPKVELKVEIEPKVQEKPPTSPNNNILDEFLYLGQNSHPLPVTVKSISKEHSSCELVYNSQTHRLIIGQSNNQLKLLSIDPKYIIVDIRQQAYKIILNKTYRTKLNSYIISKKNKLINFNHNQMIGGYKVAEVNNDKLILMDKNNKEHTLINSSKNHSNFISPLDSSVRNNLINKIGDILHFDKFAHYHFPFTLTGISKTRIQISDLKGIKSTHQINNVLINRLQLIGITAKTAKFKDMRTSKIYLLKKSEKIILRKAAFLQYKAQTHKILDQTYFLGYKVSFNDKNQLQFIGHKTKLLSPSIKQSYLEKIPQNKGKHKVKDCPCFIQPIKVVKVTPKIPDTVKPNTTKDNTATPNGLNAKNAHLQKIDLDYLVKYCDLATYKW